MGRRLDMKIKANVPIDGPQELGVGKHNITFMYDIKPNHFLGHQFFNLDETSDSLQDKINNSVRDAMNNFIVKAEQENSVKVTNHIVTWVPAISLDPDLGYSVVVPSSMTFEIDVLKNPFPVWLLIVALIAAFAFLPQPVKAIVEKGSVGVGKVIGGAVSGFLSELGGPIYIALGIGAVIITGVLIYKSKGS